MKKVKKIINKKIIITVLITMIISITIGVKAATMFSSNDVIYDNSSSGTTSNTVKEALDELYEKANNCGSTSSICTSTSGTVSYALGTEYTCDPGDGVERTFYVLEESKNIVYLIMNQNLGDTVAWNSSGSNTGGPITANNYFESQTSNWTVDVSLPTYDQIYNVNNSETLTSTPWLYDNLWTSSNTSLPYGYWTSTPLSGDSRYAWLVYSDGDLGYNYVDDTYNGVRPVITIPKDQLS